MDISSLAESAELECKLAIGANKQGKVPDDFWPTYSAMANSRGGYILLGVRERKGKFEIEGIPNIDLVQKQLFDLADNKQKVSANLLTNENVIPTFVDNKQILSVYVPAARRHIKPVYIKNQPLKETYKRLHECDHRCSEEEVKRMLAEQVETSRDDVILAGFEINDINIESLQAYKNLFSAAKPQHPFLELELFELLKKIGGWRKDRQSGEEGLTMAGVLMFGNWDAIQDAAPNYFVDYREKESAKSETRWIDRIYPDGSWSGNVFDFYRRTYRKLVSDLKVPFELEDGIRQDDTKSHQAIREALVNTLVHADYSGRSSILIVKRPDLFGFRNPGLMRVPPEVAVKGGESDCRNRRMHQMFLLIGAGERAGSGIPKIYSGWSTRRRPKLYEKLVPSEQTLLELSTESLVPQSVLDDLAHHFGDKINSLDEFERMIVATAAMESWVNHQRACELTSKHSREVTLTLPRLVDKGFLVANGVGRSKFYSIPGTSPPSPDDVFANALSSPVDLTHNDNSLTHKANNLTHNESERDQFGRLLSDKLNKPFINSLDDLESRFKEVLMSKGEEARAQKRLNPSKMNSLIVELCRGHYVAASALEDLLDRKAQSIRQNYLKALVQSGGLKMAFPQSPNSPNQGYTATDE